MALEQLANNAQTTTSAGINNSSNPVTFTVTDASKFPTSGNFRVIIGSEILKVTSVSGTSFTAARAQEGTTIATHSSGDTITHIITVGGLKQYIGEYNIVDSYSNLPAAGVPGRVFRCTNSGGYFFRDNGSSWDLYVSDMGPCDPGIANFGTWVNQSSTLADVDFTNGIYTLYCDKDANSNGRTEDLALRVQAAPGSTPWTLTAALRIRGQPQASMIGGIVTRDSGTGHITAACTGFGAGYALLYRWNDPQSFSGNPFASSAAATLGGWLWWVRVVNDGTNYDWYTSGDGISWHRFYREAVSGAFVASCTHVGLFMNYQNRNITGTPIPRVATDFFHAKVT